MNSKSAATTVVASIVLVVILSVAVGITDGFYAFKETRYSSFSKRVIGPTGSMGSTGSNIVLQFSGEWYDAYFKNYVSSSDGDPETECYREMFVIDPVTGSLTITGTTYKVSDGTVADISEDTYVKVNDDPKTNTEWKTQNQDAILKLQKITKEFAVYTITYDKTEVYLNVLSKNAVLTEEQLAEAKKIAKANHFTGDEVSRRCNTHCDKLPPLL